MSLNRTYMNQNNCQPAGRNMNQGTNQNMTCQRMNSVSRAQNSGCCAQNDNSRNTPSAAVRIPNGSRAELLCFINEVSFAAYDLMLYLDTHPDCGEALQRFQKYNELRGEALRIHAKSYGPLTLESAGEAGCSSWEWMLQPWPWELEGGAC